jgi:pyruvate/2-oxoglutarate dehydrogenase complex dihydrolipoamide acyltransferase (E2) component
METVVRFCLFVIVSLLRVGIPMAIVCNEGQVASAQSPAGQMEPGSIATAAERAAFTAKLDAALHEKVNPGEGPKNDPPPKNCNKNNYVDSAYDARTLCGSWGEMYHNEVALLRGCVLPERRPQEPHSGFGEENFCAQLAEFYESRGDYVQASLAAATPGCQSSDSLIGRSRCLQEEAKIYQKVGRPDLQSDALRQLCSSFDDVNSCASLNAMGASINLAAVQASAAAQKEREQSAADIEDQSRDAREAAESAASAARTNAILGAMNTANTTIQNSEAERQADLQAMAVAAQQRQQAQEQARLAAEQRARATQATTTNARSAPSNTNTSPSSALAATPSTNNTPYSSIPAQGSYNPYTGTGSGSVQGSCTDMTGSVQGTAKVGSDGWVSGYLTNNSNQALFVSYTFKQNGVPSTAMANAGGTTIQGGQTVGGEGQGLYSTGADKNPPEIYWYAVLKSEHDKYGCVHKW